MPQFSDEFLDQWEQIVAGVNKTDVPLECIKKVILKFHGRQQQTINLHTLRKQGLDYDDIENMLTRTFNDLDDKIRDIDFVVDISAVAAMVQPETDRLLKKL